MSDFDFIKGTILILEDDEGVAVLQERRLTRLGHQVLIASTVEEGRKRIENNEVDLVVLDYRLSSSMTGIDFYKELNSRGISIPAILVTGLSDEKVVIEAIRAGLRDFLPKSSDYLEDLPRSVERVMKQVSIERRLAYSEAVREQQEQFALASEAARLGYWRWEIRDDKVSCSGFHEVIGHIKVEDRGFSLQEILYLILESDRDALLSALELAKKSHTIFEHQFRARLRSGDLIWAYAKGQFEYSSVGEATSMMGVVLDITHQKEAEVKLSHSYEQIKSLNERLRLSMTETHHRVKNSLQLISALLNLQLRAKGTVSPDDLKKMIAHVQGFATLHDILTVQVRDEREVSSVCVKEIFEKLLSILSSVSAGREIKADLSPCSVSSRQGSSLAVVLNELVSNALKHCEGPVTVTLQCKDGLGKLEVLSQGSNFPANFNSEGMGRTGLMLLNGLCKSDLGAEPIFENVGDSARVTVKFKTSDSCNSVLDSNSVELH